MGFSTQFASDEGRMTLQVQVANNGDVESGPIELRVTSTTPALSEKQFRATSIPPRTTEEVPVPFDVPRGLWGSTVRLDVEALPLENEANLENNRYGREFMLPTLDAPRKPNLSLSRPGWESEGNGKQLRLWIMVNNSGNLASGETRLVVSADDKMSGSATVPPIGEQGSRTCTLVVDVPQDLRGKKVELVARVDPQNTIDEYDEGDNTLSITIDLPPAQAAPKVPVVPVVIAGAVLLAGAAVWLFIQRAASAANARSLPEARKIEEPPSPKPEPKRAVKPQREAAGAVGAIGPKATDDVYFTVTAPAKVMPKANFIVNVWAHLDAQRKEVLRRAHQAEPDTRQMVATKGSVAIEPDTDLDIHLEIVDCSVEPDKETIHWTGAIANADFSVTVNENAASGDKKGHASVYCGGVELTRVRFTLKVSIAEGTAERTSASARVYDKAFASYDHRNSIEVLKRIEGLQHNCPKLKIFLDEADAVAGATRWATWLEEEILTSDVLYLFWSKEAATSEWVNKEWRFGFDRKGLEFIDPFPLDATPFPHELGALQFKDKWRILRAGIRADAETKA